MDYYEVLGVPRNAAPRRIRSAFRSLARRHHPDAGAGASPERFRLAQEAYATLRDPVRRQAYDRLLRSAPPPAAPVPVWHAPAPETWWTPPPGPHHAGPQPAHPSRAFGAIEEMIRPVEWDFFEDWPFRRW